VAGADISELALQTPSTARIFRCSAERLSFAGDDGKPSTARSRIGWRRKRARAIVHDSNRKQDGEARATGSEARNLPGYGGSQDWPGCVGKGVAHELCLTGK